MKIVRRANAEWTGSGKEGKGKISTQSKALDQLEYNFDMRFSDGNGTNPEELIAAAHAACYCMKLSFVLNDLSYTAEKLNCSCKVTLKDGRIKHSDLKINAIVPEISNEQFYKAAIIAKDNCPISLSLNADITLEFDLNESIADLKI